MPSIKHDEAKTAPFLTVKDPVTKKINKIAFPSEVQVGLNENPAGLVLHGGVSFKTINFLTSDKNQSIINVSNDDTIVDISVNVIPNTGRITVNLPNRPRKGQLHFIKDESGTSATYPIDVYPPANKTIDGESIRIISSSHSSIALYYSSLNNWKVLIEGGGAGSTGPQGPSGSAGAAGQDADRSASYVVMSLTGSLFNERVLTAGSGIAITDGGANGAVTVSTTVTSGSMKGYVSRLVFVNSASTKIGSTFGGETCQAVPAPWTTVDHIPSGSLFLVWEVGSGGGGSSGCCAGINSAGGGAGGSGGATIEKIYTRFELINMLPIVFTASLGGAGGIASASINQNGVGPIRGQTGDVSSFGNLVAGGGGGSGGAATSATAGVGSQGTPGGSGGSWGRNGANGGTGGAGTTTSPGLPGSTTLFGISGIGAAGPAAAGASNTSEFGGASGAGGSNATATAALEGGSSHFGGGGGGAGGHSNAETPIISGEGGVSGVEPIVRGGAGNSIAGTTALVAPIAGISGSDGVACRYAGWGGGGGQASAANSTTLNRRGGDGGNGGFPGGGGGGGGVAKGNGGASTGHKGGDGGAGGDGVIVFTVIKE